MLIDCHCHILPQIDDGSKRIAEGKGSGHIPSGRSKEDHRRPGKIYGSSGRQQSEGREAEGIGEPGTGADTSDREDGGSDPDDPDGGRISPEEG